MFEHADQWHCHVSKFRIVEAQVTAVPDAGEMMVQAGLQLLVAEGRQESLRDNEEGEPGPSVLEYFCRVTLDGAKEPLVWSGENAHIVIAGVHENGSRITLAGAGMFGRDDNGNLALEFEALPQMKVMPTAVHSGAP